MTSNKEFRQMMTNTGALMTRKVKWLEVGDTVYMFARFHMLTRVEHQTPAGSPPISRFYIERLDEWIECDPDQYVLGLKEPKELSQQERKEITAMLMTWRAKWVEVGDLLFTVGGFDTVTKIKQRIPSNGFPVLRFYLEDSEEWAEYDPEEFVLAMGDIKEMSKRLGRNTKEQRAKDKPLTN